MHSSEFADRRKKLCEALPPKSIVLIPANREVTRSRDTEHPFRQDSYFYYLTGIREPEGLLVLSNHNSLTEQLFILPADPEQEIWHGRRIGNQKATDLSGVETVATNDDLLADVVDLVQGHSTLCYPHGIYDWFDNWVSELLQTMRQAPKRKYKAPATLTDACAVLDEQRLIKSDAELDAMRKAAQISVDAHLRAMRFTRPGVREYQVEAELHHEFVMQGASGPAYGTICGGGVNGCILHYTANESMLNDGDLLLIDAGAEFNGYAADITRTFPVNGKFSDAQRKLYTLVLDAQEAALQVLKPGATLPEAHEASAKVMVQGLIQFGLLSDDPEEHLREKNYRKFYMHSLGHWLGLDVHDAGSYDLDGSPRKLEPGMVITVEPGLYVSPDSEAPEEFCGIGIRIEDDIIITTDGYENMTAGVPKTIADIEQLMTEQESPNPELQG